MMIFNVAPFNPVGGEFGLAAPSIATR